jgi:hypothetical protein
MVRSDADHLVDCGIDLNQIWRRGVIVACVAKTNQKLVRNDS